MNLDFFIFVEEHPRNILKSLHNRYSTNRGILSILTIIIRACSKY